MYDFSKLNIPLGWVCTHVIGAIQLVKIKMHSDTILTDAKSILTEVIPFEKQDKKILESIASQAATVIGNAKILDSI